MFKFSQALVIAVILVAFALLNKQLGAERIFLIVLYLLLATVFPWLMVPVGVVAIIWQMYNTSLSGQIASWAKGFAPQPADKIGAGAH